MRYLPFTNRVLGPCSKYGYSFFLFDLWFKRCKLQIVDFLLPLMDHALPRIRNLQYGSRTRLVRHLLYLYCVCGFGNDFYSHRMASNFCTQIQSKTCPFEIAVNSLTRFNTRFGKKNKKKLLLATKVKSTWR